MADYTKTISNGINLFGLGPSTKWGGSNGFGYTMTWGTSLWGENGFVIVHGVEKLIANAPTFDTIVIKDVIHYDDIGSMTLATAIINDVIANFDIGTMIVSADLSSETLSQGDWSYVFPPSVTNLENRVFSSFTCATVATTSYTCLSVATTTWS